jgi:hypothetical protein
MFFCVLVIFLGTVWKNYFFLWITIDSYLNNAILSNARYVLSYASHIKAEDYETNVRVTKLNVIFVISVTDLVKKRLIYLMLPTNVKICCEADIFVLG